MLRSMPLPRVTIIGTGNLGTAVGAILAGRADVRAWDKDPAKSPPGVTREDALRDAQFVFLCMPSWVLRAGVIELAPLLPAGAVVVGMSKGIEADGNKFVDELLEELVPAANPVALLAGPMVAAELSAGKRGAAVAASRHDAASASLAALFAGTQLTVEESRDPRGAAVCGVLKNVYAAGLGILGALGRADNVRGLFVSRALREMSSVVAALGGDASTALGPAGAGDLVATGLSPHSRNRQYGEAIVRDGSCPPGSEAGASLPGLSARLGGTAAHPALDAVHRVIIGNEKAAEVFGGPFGA